MNCRKCGSLLNGNEVICRICGENNSVGLNNNLSYVNQNMNQSMMQQQYGESMQQPMYGMQNNQYVQPPKKNGAFAVIFIFMLLVIIGLGGFVGYKLLSQYDTKKVEEKKTTISDNKEEIINKTDNNEETINKKDDVDEKEVIATNVYYYDISNYKFPVPKELIVERDMDSSLIITDNSSFQLQFSLAADSYSNCKNNPEAFKKNLESLGVTITDNYERKYAGKNFYIFKIVAQSKLALFYLTEVDDDVVGMGIIMATSLSAYESGLNYVSRMVTNASKTSNFATGENSVDLSKGPQINKDIFNNAKIESVEYTE